MADKWPKVKIDDIKAKLPGAIAIGPFGSRMKAELYVKEGTPVLRGNNLGGRKFTGDFVYVPEAFAAEMPNCLVTKNDLVFPHRGAIGEVGIVAESKTYIISTSLMKLTLDTELAVPEYVYQFFKSSAGRYELLKNASTVGTPGIGTPLTSLRNIEIPLPPVFIQRQIASILSAFDDKIELNRRMNRTLEQMARALFKSWFVDFDPVRTKMRGEEPEGMDADTAALFPDRLVEIEGREVPEGWTWKTVDELYTLYGGSTPSTTNPAYWEGGTLNWTSPRDLSGLDVPFLTQTEKKITEAGVQVISSGILPSETILLSSRAPVGYLAISDKPISINQGYIAIRPKAALERYFTLNLLQSQLDGIKALASGTTFPELSKTTFRTFSVLTPPLKLSKAFEEAVESLYNAIKNNVYESDRIARLRDVLLPKLLSGEVKVADED